MKKSKSKSKNRINAATTQKIIVPKQKCMSCRVDDCWRTDVNYCWDCFKYQMCESR